MTAGFVSYTAAHAFKVAFYTAIRDLMGQEVDTQYVGVSLGTPATMEPDDLVAFMGVRTEQSVATIGNRSRDETLFLDVQISCRRGGDSELDVQTRAYELLGIIEQYARKKDPTIGGTVMWCFLTSTETAGYTDPDDIANGRVADIHATFQAQARISL